MAKCNARLRGPLPPPVCLIGSSAIPVAALKCKAEKHLGADGNGLDDAGMGGG